MFCQFPATVTVGYGDRAAQIPAELVSGSYFPTLGVGTALGRAIVEVLPPEAVAEYHDWLAVGNRVVIRNR
jgi:hypothetical protein